MTLDELHPDQECTIMDVAANGDAFQRLLDLGFIDGTHVKMIRNAPLLDPIDVQVRGTLVAIRRSEASGIEVQLT